MYQIIGGDDRQYGPVSETDVRQWIAEGRLNGQSLAKAEGDAEFRPLATFPEFAAALGADALPPIAPLREFTPADFQNRDYELDLGGCIARGYQLLKDNFSVVFVGVLLYLVIVGFLNGLSNIPFVGPVFSIVSFIITGPLIGGVYFLLLQAIRREPVEVSAVFEGFRRQFGQLFLGTFIQGLIIGACLLPAIIFLIIAMVPALQRGGHATPDELIAALKPALLSSLPVWFICAIPVIYLSVCWKFTLPLIIDRRLDFWTAMKTSFRLVNKHWWQVFGLFILIELVVLAGLLACCVGALFTVPIGLGALMYAYETIFGESKT